MKFKAFKKNGKLICFYKKHNSADLIDTKRFKHHPSFRNFKELFGVKHEEMGRREAMKILDCFFDLLADELIEKRNSFVIPYYDGFLLLVTETTNPDRDDYIYALETGGRYYKPVLWWNRPKYKKPVTVRFTRRRRQQLFEKRKIK